MSFLICEHETGWQWKTNYIQENSKWNWHVIKKMCPKFPFVHIIDLFCWCSFRGNYTNFILYKIVIFSVHIFIKILGRGREKFKTFLWLSGGKTQRTHLIKVISRNPKCQLSLQHLQQCYKSFVFICLLSNYLFTKPMPNAEVSTFY